MIQLSGKQLLNLQEQVQKNKIDIELWKSVSNLGVKVIGKVATPEELPDPETTPGLSYGEAFLVGQVNDYDVYIFTRPFEEGEPVQWLNVGKIGMKGDTGEAGPPGPEGPRGLRGSQWTVDTVNPTSPYGAEENDSWLNTTTGEVFKFDGFRWNRAGNISGGVGPVGPRGPEGPQGPVGPQGVKGDTGDVGGFIKVIGILSNADQLPTPASLGDLTKAYLVGAVRPYHLWIQIGATSATATWNDMGELNNGTLVSVDGQNQNTWDADSKVDKITAETVYTQVYAKYANGSQTMLNVVMPEYAVNNAGLVYRDSNGHIRVADPVNDLDAVNKRYTPVKFAEEEYSKSINLFRNTLSAGTYSGVTFSVNENGVLSMTGTATATGINLIFEILYLSAGTYIVRNFSTAFSGSAPNLTIRLDSTGGTQIYAETGDVERTFTLTEGHNVYIGMRTSSGTAYNGTLRPVITKSENAILKAEQWYGPIIHKKDLEPVLLWSNPNPTSNLTSSVSIKYSIPYKYLVILYRLSANTDNAKLITKVLNENNKYINLFGLGTDNSTYHRTIQTVNNGYTIDMGSGYKNTTVNNSCLIVTEIYGTNIL